MRFGAKLFRATGLLFAVVVLAAPGAADAQAVVQLGSGFSLPSGVAVDSSGNVFVADTGNGAISGDAARFEQAGERC